MDVENLSAQQLMVLKNQLEEEIEKLTSSFSQLRHAGTKYRASRAAIDSLEQKEILVPLTASLYVPGTLLNPETVTVDIGAGYFVEKNKQEAKEFCERKMLMLRENMDKLSTLISQRRRSFELVIQTMQKKQQA